jgi:uncharacterized protein
MNDQTRAAESTPVDLMLADGTALSGTFLPAGDGNQPVVVLSNPLTTLKEQYSGGIARELQARGIPALTYDYRGWGTSEGGPRQEFDPARFADDLTDVITTAKDLPGVDPARIVLFGSGHGTVPTASAASMDPRVAATVLQGPYLSEAGVAAYPKGWLLEAWDERIRAADYSGGPIYRPAWPETAAEAQDPGFEAYFMGEAALGFSQAMNQLFDPGPTWQNTVTLQTFRHLAITHVSDLVLRIPSPLLYTPLAGGEPFGAPIEMHRSILRKLGDGADYFEMPTREPTVDCLLTTTGGMVADYVRRVL